jgi:hypothetical protein
VGVTAIVKAGAAGAKLEESVAACDTPIKLGLITAVNVPVTVAGAPGKYPDAEAGVTEAIT